MFNQHWRIFVVGLSLLLSASVIAQNGAPDHASQKKAEQTAGSDQEQAETRNERAEREAERGQERAERNAEREQERAEQEAEQAQERAKEGRESSETERNSDDRQNKRQDDMPPGLADKETAPQSGKGSDKGQEKREEKSSAWWKFWD